MAQSEDQWSTSNLGDEISLPTELHSNSVGGQLHAILHSDYATSLSQAKSCSPLLEAEVKDWEARFPNLLIQGHAVQAEEQHTYIHEQIKTQRLSVARRLVLTLLFPEIQNIFQDELGMHLSAPKSSNGRSKSSKTTIDKTETKFTLPAIHSCKK